MTRAEREREQAAAWAKDTINPPTGCPMCLTQLRELSDLASTQESMALRLALREVLDASQQLAAEEVIPRRLFLALHRAGDVLADVEDIPF